VLTLPLIGPRSGLNVQNPNRPDRAPGGNDVAREILRKAAEAGAPPSLAGGGPGGGAGPSSAPSWGRGQTLGADASAEGEMEAEDEQEADEDEDEEVVVRHLTFWRDGFSIEDGELRRYDDPTSKAVLDAINNGCGLDRQGVRARPSR
jgi:UBX domain-containing protein 1